ncbi:MAG: hypothetical protein AAGJ84_13685 [Pseudomonadota bacterium]
MKMKLNRRQMLTQMGIASTIVGGAASVPASAEIDDDAEWQKLWSNDQPSNLNHLTIPDRQHIKRRGRGWQVRPTGSDDKANLEWALRNTPPGGIVRLTHGTFKIGSPIVVADFDGRLVGRGSNSTTVTCTDEFSLEIWEAPGGGRDRGEPKPPPFPRVPVNGSKTKTPPALFEFYKTPLQPGERVVDRATKIEVRGIRCRGAMIGELWAFGDEVLCINVLNSFDWHDPEARQQTTRQDFEMSDVEVDGYRSAEFGVFENACACITVAGSPISTANYNLDGETDGDAFGLSNGGLLEFVPAPGDVTMESCLFRNCRLGPGVVGYKDGRALFSEITTDGCRGNCLQIIDNSNMTVIVRDCDLFCDSFILPPQLVGGIEGLPSSQGCVIALQGSGAAIGYPSNLQWFQLAYNQEAHDRHPEAGPLGTWRPQGPQAAPQRSNVIMIDNTCRSSRTANTYCFHAADLSNFAFSQSTLRTIISNNDCTDSETCISLEHIDRARVRRNECSSLAFGIELHNSPDVVIRNNQFSFTGGEPGCEIRSLNAGAKLDLSRVVPGAGVCL